MIFGVAFQVNPDHQTLKPSPQLLNEKLTDFPFLAKIEGLLGRLENREMKKRERWDRLKRGEILLLDGPMGTELQQLGVSLEGPSWSAQAIVSNPDDIARIHENYAEAGSDILTTNTFRTHERNLIGTPFENRGEDLTKLAVDLTHKVAKDNLLVAGSLSPLEDCYRIDVVSGDENKLYEEHLQQAERLSNAGVDLILAETFGTIFEASIALKAGLETKLPVWVSFVCGADGNLLSGETVVDAYQAMSSIGCEGFLLNCLPAPEAITPLKELVSFRSKMTQQLTIGIYANTGRMKISSSKEIRWESTEAEYPSQYAECAKRWISEGATIIGGCCGTTPEHIRSLHEMINR